MRMVRVRWPVLVCCLGCAGVLARGAEPAALPAASTQPAISDRQASILLQLADAEANIKVINQALIRTGYKVGLAYERIENSQKGNELMDRNGGGPVRWDEFYGRTARDFYAPQNVGGLHARGGRSISVDVKVATGYRPLQRPPQFDHIYRANDQQISRARDQIASLLQDQTALLARRHQHEADQSTLWAELAWEQARDREISFRPTYRFALKGDATRVALIRGPILFLRIVDQAVVDGLDSVASDQAGTFGALHDQTKAGYAGLQETMSDALLAPSVSATDAKEAGDLKAMCKQIAEECAVIDDNYRKAADSDRANEDASKLEYRGQLQTSLAKLAGLIGGLDDQISKVAAGWGLAPDLAAPLLLPRVDRRVSVTAPSTGIAAPVAPAAPKSVPEVRAGADNNWRPADGRWVRRWTGKGSELNAGSVVQIYEVFGGGTRVRAYQWNLPFVREKDGSLRIEYTHFFQVFTKVGTRIEVREWKTRADYEAGEEALYDGVFEPDLSQSERPIENGPSSGSSSTASASAPLKQLTPQQRAIAAGLQFSDLVADGNEHHRYGGASIHLRNASPFAKVTERVRARTRLLCIKANGELVVLEIWGDVNIGRRGDQVLYLGRIENSQIRFNNANRTTPVNAHAVIYLADVPIYEGIWKPGDTVRWWEDFSPVKK